MSICVKRIRLVLIICNFVYVNLAPIQQDIDTSVPAAYFFDIDAEQVRARYDPRQISANIGGIPSSTSNEDATSCQTADGRYGHGQKVYLKKNYDALTVEKRIVSWKFSCNTISIGINHLLITEINVHVFGMLLHSVNPF